ncbi:MAG: AmmeMemoRadiSam system protein A [Synergistaceae bacterium]|jgi:AmmeMemoRadiSam system protein A|nr:AmmeMemoRadiSam system protein A [Synergistaceae bacterium]
MSERKDATAPHPYVVLAMETVRRHLSGEPPLRGGTDIDRDSSLWEIKRACFVSIKTLSGDLRGCIGTIKPQYTSLDLEIMANAVSSSTRDPRFPPMTLAEMSGVAFSVDVLSRPERVSGMSDLDPLKWGIIVSKGTRRGVLLPDLEGVDTVRAQIEIASRKAGIFSLDGIAIDRFLVDRHR